MFVIEKRTRPDAEAQYLSPGSSTPGTACWTEFMAWRGEKPITVQWKLPEAVPARLPGDLGVSDVS